MNGFCSFKGEARAVTTTFEQAFADAERSAAAAAKAGSLVVSAAKQMQKAAQEGDIRKLRLTAEKLASATDAARQDVANAKTAWPFSEIEEREYLTNEYDRELREEAKQAGLNIKPLDAARLFAYPSILRILPSELSVRVDKKKVPSLRPSHLVQLLLANQKKKSRYPVERFLESLHSAYMIVVPKGERSEVVKLTKIYQALTLLPGAGTEYSKSEFARDLFMLDQSGNAQTRSGARLSLPASTGTRGSNSDLYKFVGPDGVEHMYYGILFTEG
jgi:hypothetical protein